MRDDFQETTQAVRLPNLFDLGGIAPRPAMDVRGLGPTLGDAGTIDVGANGLGPTLGDASIPDGDTDGGGGGIVAG